MGCGIHAEVQLTGPDVCQIASATQGGGRATAVARSVTGPDDGRVVEEFTLTGTEPPGWAEAVFRDGTGTVCRFARDRGQGCFCERVEVAGCPVREVVAEDGRVHVTFVAPDVETLREVVVDLGEASDGVSVRRLTRGESEGGDADLVYVDRDALTDRQREVLRTAHEMGYFEHPKGANAGEVATALDIGTSTFAEHLAAAQSKLLDAVIDA